MSDHRRGSFSRPVHLSLFHPSDDNQVIAFLNQSAAYCPAFGLHLLIVRDVAFMPFQIIDQLPRRCFLPALAWIVLADIADRFGHFTAFQVLGQRLSVSLFGGIILIGLARAMADLLLGVIQIQPRLGIGEDHLL